MSPLETLAELVKKGDPRGKIVRIFRLPDVGYVVNVGSNDGVGHALEDAIYRCYDQIIGVPDAKRDDI